MLVITNIAFSILTPRIFVNRLPKDSLLSFVLLTYDFVDFTSAVAIAISIC